MPSKRVDVFDSTKTDTLDKIIQSLNTSGNDNGNDKPSNKDEPVEKQPTIVDEYLEMLRMRRQVAKTIFSKYLVNLLNDYGNVDPNHIKEIASLIGLYLGIGDRWSNEVLKTAIVNEMGIYGGITSKVYPEYIGDPIANYERSVSIGTKDDTSVLLANLLQLLGINLSPEMVDKIAKLFKDKLSNK